MGEDLRAIVSIEGDHLAHWTPNCGGATDDRSGTRPDDQIKSKAEIKAIYSGPFGLLFTKTFKERGCIDAAHSATIKAQHPKGSVYIGFSHGCQLS
jgi:hypothetical protein